MDSNYFSPGYFKSKFNEIPKDILERAKNITLQVLSENDKKSIIDCFNKYGSEEWLLRIDPSGRAHFTFGMWFRNKLRDGGLYDDYLPDKNWDDYYVAVIEYSLDLIK